MSYSTTLLEHFIQYTHARTAVLYAVRDTAWCTDCTVHGGSCPNVRLARTARHSGDMTVKPICMLLGELVMVLSNKLMRRYSNASKWGTLQLNDTMTHESGLKFQNASKLWRLLKYVWTTFGHVH